MNYTDIIIAILKGLPWTVALTAGSFVLGAILAVPICTMRVSRNRFLKNLAAALILTFRSIPPIVWLFFIFFAFSEHVFQLDPFLAAVIGLGVITAANLAEVYRGALTAVPKGQFEASAVLGLNFRQKYWDVIIPQVFRISLPSAATYCIGLLKDTAVASAIGVPELAQVSYYISQQTFKGLSIYAIAAVLYFLMSFLMAWASRRLDIKLRAKVER